MATVQTKHVQRPACDTLLVWGPNSTVSSSSPFTSSRHDHIPIHLFPPWPCSRQVENNVGDGFYMARRKFKFFWRVIQVSSKGLYAYSWTSLNFDVPLPWGLNPFEKIDFIREYRFVCLFVLVLFSKKKCFSFLFLIFFKVRSWNSKGEVSEVASFDFTDIGL